MHSTNGFINKGIFALNRVLSALALAALITPAALISTPASAAEVSGNVTLASDYSFRGISQTTRDPAIQGGFDVAYDSGFYIGTWASTVNYGTSGVLEWDLYVGWSGEIAEGVGIDLTAIQFEYPSEGAADYQEYAVSLSFGNASVGVVYSPEYLGDGGESFIYPNAGYSFPLNDDVSVDLSIGLNMSDDPAFFSDGVSDEDTYIDYSVVLNVPVGGIDVGLGVYGTDVDDEFCGNDCDSRFILSLSKSL